MSGSVSLGKKTNKDKNYWKPIQDHQTYKLKVILKFDDGSIYISLPQANNFAKLKWSSLGRDIKGSIENEKRIYMKRRRRREKFRIFWSVNPGNRNWLLQRTHTHTHSYSNQLLTSNNYHFQKSESDLSFRENFDVSQSRRGGGRVYSRLKVS